MNLHSWSIYSYHFVLGMTNVYLHSSFWVINLGSEPKIISMFSIPSDIHFSSGLLHYTDEILFFLFMMVILYLVSRCGTPTGGRSHSIVLIVGDVTIPCFPSIKAFLNMFSSKDKESQIDSCFTFDCPQAQVLFYPCTEIF